MKSKIWLITGVSKGLGRALAGAALAQGDQVIGTVRTAEDKVDFEKHPHAKAFLIDMLHTHEIPSMIAQIMEEYATIDVLVNNAGYGAFGMIEEFEEEEVIRQFLVNFIAPWKLVKSVLPYMRSNKNGTIVQISSRAGLMAAAGNGIYAASKFATEAMMEALHLEVSKFGINILLVEPGALRTDFFGESLAYAQDEIDFYREKLTDLRKNTSNLHGKQTGDPVKAAAAILEAVNNGGAGLRLPLTSGAIEAMNFKIEEFQATVLINEEIARSINY